MASLYALIARNAPRAVIFRRGPSKRVLLIAWDLANDTFEEGQWLNGRIYERRCDLSPDGKLLLYFAASWRPPYQSWTAVSRPPYFTALALWPKGDAWGGGGLFASPNTIALNHFAHQITLADEFSLRKDMLVTTLGPHAGRGEDDPIWSARLERDGWTRTSSGKSIERYSRPPVWLELEPPLIWEKPHRVAPLTLRMSITGIKEQNGPWYRIEHALIGRDGATRTLRSSSWADWSHEGDLLYAIRGALFRASFVEGALGEAKQLADFTDRTFVSRAAPPPMQRWR